jgi:AcrR family transcriptional regulator
MDEQLIADLSIDGMRPAQQRRTRELVLRMFQTGRGLLRDRDFDSLSIEDLCKGAGTTVGSFYARFESKDIFITALQHVVVEETRLRMESDYRSNRVPDDNLEHFLSWMTKGAAVWYRANEGLVRASLRQAARDPQAWTPIRLLGQTQARLGTPRIMALVDDPRRTGVREAVQFAFQVLHGTLNNLVLIDPGPFAIHDAATPRMLATAMLRLIESPRRPATRLGNR